MEEYGPVLAIVLTVVVHFAGISALLAFAGGDLFEVFRTKPAGGEEGGEPRAESPVDPAPPGDTAPPLLPDAAPRPIRLRGPERIPPAPRRERRPAHEPEREREPA